MSNLNKASLDAAYALLRAKEFETDGLGVLVGTESIDTASIIGTNTTKRYLKDGANSDWATAGHSWGNTTFFTRNHSSTYDFEEMLLNFFSLTIVVDDFTTTVSVGDAGNDLTYDLWYSYDGGTTYTAMGSVTIAGDQAGTITWAVNAVTIPLSLITGDVEMRLSYVASVSSPGIVHDMVSNDFKAKAYIKFDPRTTVKTWRSQ